MHIVWIIINVILLIIELFTNDLINLQAIFTHNYHSGVVLVHRKYNHWGTSFSGVR